MPERLGPFYAGEAAVISSSVHIISPQRPGEVGVLLADAGQTFYGRQQPHKIAHIDIFHQWGNVMPDLVADAVRTAAGHKALDPDLTDIQTGLGGGCASGSLKFGRRRSLRKTHMNHVHIATLRLYPGLLEEAEVLNCELVHRVEQAILETCLGLRRVDRIIRLKDGSSARDQAPLDLSPYSDCNDSILAASPMGEVGTPTAQTIQRTADTMRTTLPELRECLKDAQGITGQRRRHELMQKGIVELGPAREVRLTKKGNAMLYLLEHRMPELEASLISSARQAARKSGFSMRRVEATHGAHRTQCMPREEAPPVASLAVAETVTEAFHRQGSLSVKPPDIRMQARRRPPRADVLFLVDGSASMEGQRIHAARGVIRTVAASGRGRCGAIVFQERTGEVVVPMTRAIGTVLDCASHLKPAGLTPLAAGFKTAHKYLREVRSRHCVLVVITDGIPTVSMNGRSPLDEAINEAKDLAQVMPHGLLIGIDANTRYLETMARWTGWKLALFDDLRQDSILQEIGKVLTQAVR